MEPEMPGPNFKSMAPVLWVALITAVIVTLIDWKIKQDILRLTDAFYRIYPSMMEEQNGVKNSGNNHTDNIGRIDSGPVLRVPVVDSDARLEEKDSDTPVSKNPEDHSDAWARFAPELETGIQSTTASDSGPVQA